MEGLNIRLLYHFVGYIRCMQPIHITIRIQGDCFVGIMPSLLFTSLKVALSLAFMSYFSVYFSARFSTF